MLATLSSIFFLFQKLLLAFDAPLVPCQISGPTNHPVTRNQDCQTIRSTSSGHGTDGLGLSEGLGELGVAYRFSRWNLGQGPPHLFLTARASNIQGKLHIACLSSMGIINLGHHLRYQFLPIFLCFLQLCRGEVFLQYAQDFFFLYKLDQANSTIGCANQNTSKACCRGSNREKSNR